MNYKKINYIKLNSRQKESYNYQKVSSRLADYGFQTTKLSDDWKGADFLAQHTDGKTLLKVQLKGRFSINKKYLNKDIYICFMYNDNLYLYPHDETVDFILNNSNVAKTGSWKNKGDFTWKNPPPKQYQNFLRKFKLKR